MKSLLSPLTHFHFILQYSHLIPANFSFLIPAALNPQKHFPVIFVLLNKYLFVCYKSFGTFYIVFPAKIILRKVAVLQILKGHGKFWLRLVQLLPISSSKWHWHCKRSTVGALKDIFFPKYTLKSTFIQCLGLGTNRSCITMG